MTFNHHGMGITIREDEDSARLAGALAIDVDCNVAATSILH